jgi:hypothetical protein
MWSTESGEATFTTSAQPAGGGDERVVIDQGLVRYG